MVPGGYDRNPTGPNHCQHLLKAVSSSPSLRAVTLSWKGPPIGGFPPSMQALLAKTMPTIPLDQTQARGATALIRRQAPSTQAIPLAARDQAKIRAHVHYIWSANSTGANDLVDSRMEFVERLLNPDESTSLPRDAPIRLIETIFPPDRMPEVRDSVIAAIEAKGLMPRIFTFAANGLVDYRSKGDHVGCTVLAQSLLETMQNDANRLLCADLAGPVFIAASDMCTGRTMVGIDGPEREWFPAVQRCLALMRIQGEWMRDRMVLWRRAVCAHRDAGRVFRAARDGRPLELGKRLMLGKLAGGLAIKGVVRRPDGEEVEVGPMEAARLGGHDDCVKVLEEVVKGRDGTS